MTLRCLIIDDEQLAREMLAAYATQIIGLHVVEKCKNTAEAAKILQKEQIDLLLLDIQMPRMTGTEFLRQLNNPPKVIFTTAFANYALEGYELEVVDYLLKPIGFDRFETAITKVRDLVKTEKKALAFEGEQTFETQFILVKEGYNHHKILLKDILYITAMREYVQYHTAHGRIMELKSISKVNNLLPDSHFIRIHRSYIVAKSAVLGHDKNVLLLEDDVRLAMGKTYKQLAMKVLF